MSVRPEVVPGFSSIKLPRERFGLGIILSLVSSRRTEKEVFIDVPFDRFDHIEGSTAMFNKKT